ADSGLLLREGLPSLSESIHAGARARRDWIFDLPGCAGYNQSSSLRGAKMVFIIALLYCFQILAAQDFDVILQNGRVVDGMGNPWYRADVGIRDGKIAAIGDLHGRDARRTLALNEQVVAPGS